MQYSFVVTGRLAPGGSGFESLTGHLDFSERKKKKPNWLPSPIPATSPGTKAPAPREHKPRQLLLPALLCRAPRARRQQRKKLHTGSGAFSFLVSVSFAFKSHLSQLERLLSTKHDLNSENPFRSEEGGERKPFHKGQRSCARRGRGTGMLPRRRAGLGSKPRDPAHTGDGSSRLPTLTRLL